jgi:outer membrane protein OmpA-like peptidoglycan-associated protein
MNPHPNPRPNPRLNVGLIIAGVLAFVLLAVPVILSTTWISSAEARLEEIEAAERGEAPAVAVAQNANEEYCTPQLKTILRRVLMSCGLIGSEGARGCQPATARNVATMEGDDFNALFLPMQGRGGIVQYERGSAELDAADLQLIDRTFADRRGASYFFVVSRASPEGSTESNSELSRQRAEAIMTHLDQRFDDPELAREVGLLWLGEEYAQLDPSFCEWTRSGETEQCLPEELNRSAFVAWIDCRL